LATNEKNKTQRRISNVGSELIPSDINKSDVEATTGKRNTETTAGNNNYLAPPPVEV